MKTRMRWNEAEYQKLSNGGTVEQAVWRAAGRVRDRAKRNIVAAGQVDTGALLNSIISQRASGKRDGVWYQVGSDLKYAIYQHDGTKTPIRPRRAKVLRFKPSGSSTYVFAPQVRGVKGSHFLTEALAAMTINDYGP